MSKVHIPKEFGYNVKTKARHSLRRKESSLIKLSRMKKAKTISNENYLYKYLIKEDRYETKRDENGSILYSGYTPCAPYLRRWNMRGTWKQYKKFSNKRIRHTFPEEPLHHSEYKRAFDIAQFY